MVGIHSTNMKGNGGRYYDSGLIILGFSALHFVVSFGVFLLAFGGTMGRFESGVAPSLFGRVCDVAVDILWFPFMWVGGLLGIGKGRAEWLLLIANSLLWGVVLYGLLLLLKRFLVRISS
ncbi:MAG: hypothetical protein JWQ71_4944 [Pedosphaera sp.]|nr:hypothetical protein [Pedosphaera sp.]